MNEALELRVLTGLHRDARCAISDGALLGADSNCDIVLADAGLSEQAGRLRIGETAWELKATVDTEADAETALRAPETPFNHPIPLGPIWITVARQSDPWISIPDAANDAVTDSTRPDASSALSAAANADASLNNEDPSGSSLSRMPQSSSQTIYRRRDTWPIYLGLGAVVLAILVAITVTLLPASHTETREPIDPRLAAAEQSLSQINSALERLGVASRLNVSLSRDGTVTVSGWVRNTAEQDRIALALAQIWPMPAMRLSNEEDVIKTAQASLKSFSVIYVPQYQGSGRLSVAGIAPSARERASVLDTLRAQLPGMTVLGSDIQLTQDVSDALATQLSDAGLPGVTLSWKTDRLELSKTNLDEEQLNQLQTQLADFNKTHFNVATLVDTTASPGKTADSVPFQIRSVVSGSQPFIVLGDGSKLLVGGTYRRYRLVSIEPKHIVFDGPRPTIVSR